MLGFNRVKQSKGWAVSSRRGKVFIGFAGKIYRVHIELGSFTIAWERPYHKG